MNEWRSIDQEPTAPVQVELFYGNLSSRDANGNPCLHILAPHRDERRIIGFWDGERWYGMETEEDCFEGKRPVCRSRPQDLPAAEPAPVGSNPLGAGRRWLGQLQVN